MKHFLDLTGLGQFLAKLKTIFVKNISEGSTSGSFQYTTYEEVTDEQTGKTTLQTKTVSVPVHNVVTTDTTQTISGAKTFTGTVKVPDIADGATDTGLAANKGYVDSKITENDAMSYKGAVYPNSDVTEGHAHLPFAGDTKSQYKVGATFKAAAEGTYYTAAGGGTGKQQVARIGDLFIVKTVASSSPYTLTYDYIPAADDVTSIRYSTTANEVNVGTTAKYGDRVFGEAAVKQVATAFSGTYNTDAANDGQLTTVGAVAEYALKEVKNATGDSTLTIGTKTSGEQTLAVKIKSNSGISSDANGIYAVADTNNGISIDANGIGVIVNTNSGLSMDATNGVTLTAPGNGIEVDSTSHNIKAVGNSVKGIEITGSGISAKLAGTNGIKFDSNGKISLDLGDGLTETATGNKLEVKIDSTNANGLSTSSNGVALALVTPSTSGVGGTAGAMSAVDKEKLDTLDASTTVGKNGITVTKTGNETDITADINTNAGLTFTGDTEGSKQIGINNGNGIEFSSGAVQVKGNANKAIEVDSTNGVGVIANTGQGINVTSSGVGITVLTNSGLGFDTTTGGLYLESIPPTEINNLFA